MIFKCFPFRIFIPDGATRFRDALANQTRRETVVRLSAGAASTPEISRHFDFTKQALSRHLAVLESAGLISRTPRGRLDDVALVPLPLDAVERWISELRRGWTASLYRLEKVLDGRRDATH